MHCAGNFTVSEHYNMSIGLRFFTTLCLAFVLCGCQEQATLEEFIPKAEAAMAKQLLSQLAARDFAAVERQLDASLSTPQTHDQLEKVADFFPAELPQSVTVVGSHTHKVNDVTTYSLTFEYAYANAWLLANVSLRQEGGKTVVTGMQVIPKKESLKETNRFTFSGKGAMHYIVFVLAIAVPLFIFYTLVLCIKTPIAKRKWLWVTFVLLGFVQVTLNWADGGWNIQPVSAMLFGAGCSWAGPYGPIYLTVSVPLGAIVFLRKRRAFLTQQAVNVQPEHQDQAA